MPPGSDQRSKPGVALHLSATHSAAWQQQPEEREKRVAAFRARMARPEVIAKRHEALRALRTAQRRLEVRAKRTAAIQRDLSGQRFGRLVVLERAGRRGSGAAWRCRCDCGRETFATTGHLRSGHTTSCGCWMRQRTREANTRHGALAGGKRSREYTSWASAKQRCDDPSVPSFRNYGGRGIRMCAEWASSFEAFLAHIGPCPPGLTLDRINNDGNYEPGNVRWATYSQQNANRRPRVKRALEALGA